MNPAADQISELKRQLQESEDKVQRIKEQLDRAQASSVPANSGGDLLSSQGNYYLSSQDAGLFNRRSTLPATVSRSKSTAGHAMMASSVTERSQIGSHKRQRTLSQQSAPAGTMARSLSNHSESGNPFTGNGPVAPLQIVPGSGMLDHYYSCNDEPANAQVYAASMQRSQSSQRQPDLPMLAEDCLQGIGVDVGDFLAQHPIGDDNLVLSTIMVPPPPSRSYLSPTDTYRPAPAAVPSGCPSLGSATSGIDTLPSMTRENSSLGNGSVIGALEMARLGSATSRQADGFVGRDQLAQATAPPPLAGQKRPAPTEDLLFTGAGFAACSSSAPMESFIPPQATTMERSISNVSTSSNLERRAQETHRKVIENGKRNIIAPKPQEVSKKDESSDSTYKKSASKVAVTKQGSYTRPTHPRVFCDQCKEHPQGFRGDHELRRHISAKHEGIVIKWVCCDPVAEGIKTNLTAVFPLSRCKSCAQNKQYGAYYNAAAHLRRSHFTVKAPRGSKKAANHESGSEAARDWPPMPELKAWFKKIEVDLQSGRQITKREEEDAGSEDFDLSRTDGIDVGFDMNDPYDELEFSPDGYSLAVETTNSAPYEYDYSPTTATLSALQGFDPSLTAFGSTVSPSSTSATPTPFHDMAPVISDDFLMETCY